MIDDWVSVTYDQVKKGDLILRYSNECEPEICVVVDVKDLEPFPGTRDYAALALYTILCADKGNTYEFTAYAGFRLITLRK